MKKILIVLITFLAVPFCTHASVPYMLGIDEQTKMECDEYRKYNKLYVKVFAQTYYKNANIYGKLSYDTEVLEVITKNEDDFKNKSGEIYLTFDLNKDSDNDLKESYTDVITLEFRVKKQVDTEVVLEKDKEKYAFYKDNTYNDLQLYKTGIKISKNTTISLEEWDETQIKDIKENFYHKIGDGVNTQCISIDKCVSNSNNVNSILLYALLLINTVLLLINIFVLVKKCPKKEI